MNMWCVGRMSNVSTLTMGERQSPSLEHISFLRFIPECPYSSKSPDGFSHCYGYDEPSEAQKRASCRKEKKDLFALEKTCLMGYDGPQASRGSFGTGAHEIFRD